MLSFLVYIILDKNCGIEFTVESKSKVPMLSFLVYIILDKNCGIGFTVEIKANSPYVILRTN